MKEYRIIKQRDLQFRVDKRIYLFNIPLFWDTQVGGSNGYWYPLTFHREMDAEKYLNTQKETYLRDKADKLRRKEARRFELSRTEEVLQTHKF